MDTRAQIIFILACACLAECRERGKINKQGTFVTGTEKNQDIKTNTVEDHHVVARTNSIKKVVPKNKTGDDSDAIVFPKDEDYQVHIEANKMDVHDNNDGATTDKPLLPKVVPAVEAKEAFTNPITSDKIEKLPLTYNHIDKEKNIQTTQIPILLEQKEENKEAKVSTNADNDKDYLPINPNKVTNNSNGTSSSNDTVPDLSSRFGNYMLVPVNNGQTYQIPNTNAQQYPYDQGRPIAPNTGVVSRYAVPNANGDNTNVQNDYAFTPNAVQNSNYVPITVSNTYMINGQLYASVTVPNNVNVPSSVFLVNSQAPVSQYQSSNNLPLYKLVSVGGDQGNNVQFAPIN